MRCALELNRVLRQWPEVQLRMGIHTGPVYRVKDINAARNVAGGGINIAQRVMDCGDAGHILISKSVADVLDQVSTWKTALHDLGEAEVKHGVRLHIFNLCKDGAGNCEIPRKLQRAISKFLRIPERHQVEFSAELFNAFNHPQFDDPVVTPGNNPLAGKITSASDFGFTQTERVIQLGLKYSF